MVVAKSAFEGKVTAWSQRLTKMFKSQRMIGSSYKRMNRIFDDRDSGNIEKATEYKIGVIHRDTQPVDFRTRPARVRSSNYERSKRFRWPSVRLSRPSSNP